MNKATQFLIASALIVAGYYAYSSGLTNAWWNDNVPDDTTLGAMGSNVLMQTLLVVGCIAIALIAGLQPKAEGIVDIVRDAVIPKKGKEVPPVDDTLAMRLELMEANLKRLQANKGASDDR